MFENQNNAGTNGTYVTTANSASSGNAWSYLIENNVVVGASGSSSIIYSNGLASAGVPITARLTLGGVTYVRWDSTQTGSRFVLRRAFYFPSAPSGANVTLIQMRNNSSLVSQVLLPPSMRPILCHGSTQITASQPASALSTSTLYWLEVAATKESASGAGNGTVSFRITDNSNNVVHEYTYSAGSTGTTDVTQYRFGSGNATAAAQYDYLGSTRAGVLASGWFGPSSGSAPLAQAVLSSTPYQLIDASTSTTGSGGTLAYSISPSSGVISDGSGKFFVPNPTSATNYTITVTESPSGQSSTSGVISVSPLSTGSGTTSPRLRARIYNGTSLV